MIQVARPVGCIYRLAQTFGRENLFMDVDHIPAGVDFVDYLPSQVAACDVFLAVIGPNWLDAKDDDGRRRFDNPDDFVTIEIAAALARKCMHSIRSSHDFRSAKPLRFALGWRPVPSDWGHAGLVVPRPWLGNA